MSKQIRPLGFTNSLQQLVWDGNNNTPVVAYLWGGGGGGGGNDRGVGGAGGGGGFSQHSFTVNFGDVIQVAVGGKGGAGGSGASLAAGGSGGASYLTTGAVFNSRTAVASPPVVPSTNGAYVDFLNTYGVWNPDTGSAVFDRTYTVSFPVTGTYVFVASCDNSGTVFFDDEDILSVNGFTSTYTVSRQITAGNHTIRMLGNNTGGPGSFGLTVNGNIYSGGSGGAAGPSGSSGGGGGGGGATVVVLNGQVIAVAGGGAGGGGAGRNSSGDTAPGDQGQSSTATNGGAGQSHPGDGGGGGGGGGGLQGGFGGLVREGDNGARAGAFGLSSTPNQNPSGRNPGGQNNQYYFGTPGQGGGSAANGTAGYAVFEFNINGVYVHQNDVFRPASTFIKLNNEWTPVDVTWIKTEGTWRPVSGSYAPEFSKVPDNFGGLGTTCISVCDESSSNWSSNRNSWAAFMSQRPGTPFYLLGPGTSSRDKLRVPAEFVPENLGYGPINVARDNGDPAKRSDWFAIANLASAPPGSVAELSIDNSGSMTINTVRASYDYFIEQCKTAGITVVIRAMKQEKWVAPFL